jgi:hypothetical protein
MYNDINKLREEKPMDLYKFSVGNVIKRGPQYFIVRKVLDGSHYEVYQLTGTGYVSSSTRNIRDREDLELVEKSYKTFLGGEL